MKPVSPNARLWLIPWAMGLLGLGLFSGYTPFPPPDATTNARIAAMLTPLGIIESVVLNHTPRGEIDLRPYYGEPIRRGGAFDHPLLVVAYAWILIGAIGFLRAWRPFG